MQGRALHDDFVAADDANILADDLDRAASRHGDRRRTADDRQHAADCQRIRAAHVARVGAANGNGRRAAHRNRVRAADVQRIRAADHRRFRAPHRIAGGSADDAAEHGAHRARMGKPDADRKIRADRMRLVVLRQAVHVLFRLHVKFLGPQLVLEADAVIVLAPARDRLALESALRRVAGQIPRRRRNGVVEAAENQRTVRIAVHESDDHFLSDPRNVDAAEVHAGPRLAHAYPAGIRCVIACVAIPQKTDLHAAEFVGPYLVARRPDHDRGLWPARRRLGRFARHSKHLVRRLHDQFVIAFVAVAAARFVRDFGQHQRRFDDEVLAVRAVVLVLRQHERMTAGEAAHVAPTVCARPGRAALFHAHAADEIAMLAIGIVARPFEQLALPPVRLPRLVIGRDEARERTREVEIVYHDAAGPQRFVRREIVDVLDVDLPAFRVMRDLVIGLARRLAMSADVIAQDQAMLVVRMLEEPVDPPLLHQTLNEVEIGFAILHLERARLVSSALARHRILVDVEPLLDRVRVIVQDRIDDFDDALVLKNLVVARQSREPQPGAQLDAIDVIAPLAAQEARLDHEPADFARTRANAALRARPDSVELNADRHLRADHRLQVEIRARCQRHMKIVRRAQEQFVRVEFSEVLFTAQRQELERGLTEQPRHRTAADHYRAALIRPSVRKMVWHAVFSLPLT
ncbi:Uncharacterised protein [Burkholderia pseudomallei]|nr:Uncharacterised protein [Burkholderia pseudomallei]CPO36901.1 Uncharacterised protein [Burkholderia pseudomallei]